MWKIRKGQSGPGECGKEVDPRQRKRKSTSKRPGTKPTKDGRSVKCLHVGLATNEWCTSENGQRRNRGQRSAIVAGEVQG